MLKPSNYAHGDIIAMDRAYIDYAKFEELTQRGVMYVPKMKKNLVYEILSDKMHMLRKDLMQIREKHVRFTKPLKGGGNIEHRARIITYLDTKRKKPGPVSLLTNDMEAAPIDIIETYRKIWKM